MEEDPEYINSRLEALLAAGETGRKFRQISKPEITDFHFINPMRDLEQFGTHRIIVFRVNPEYVSLYERAEISSLSISEPPSNVLNGLGIFTGVNSDTLYLEVEKI